MTTMDMQAQDRVIFGGHEFTRDELISAGMAALRSTSVTTPITPTDRETARTLRGLFQSSVTRKNVWSLWHYMGGHAATLADLWIVREWVQGIGPLSRSFVSDWREFSQRLLAMDADLYSCVDHPALLGSTALALSDLLNTALTDAENAWYDEELGEMRHDGASFVFADPNPYQPVIDGLSVFLYYLAQGTDENGHYLPDDLVYNSLAGEEPHAL